MKILLCSHQFYPSIGGIEAISETLAAEFVRAGHNVTVVTMSSLPPGGRDDYIFTLVRRPSPSLLLRLIARSDVVFHNNVSLRTAWPLLFMPRPWIVAYQIALRDDLSLAGLMGVIKRFILRGAHEIAVSRAIADDTWCSEIIPNPYAARQFRLMPEVARKKALIFVGRFVAGKGLPILFSALRILHERGIRVPLTVVGAGPEDESWRALPKELDLEEQVAFVGPRRGEDLARLLNAHYAMVIPSTWDEPFGIVALEGMACGCLVIGSDAGGLPDAIGRGGVLFPNGDADALARRLEESLRDDRLSPDREAAMRGHLKLHEPAVIARHYLDVFARCLAGSVS